MRFLMLFSILFLLLAGLSPLNEKGKTREPKGQLSKCFQPEVKTSDGFKHPGGLHSQEQIQFARKKIKDGEYIRSSAYKLLVLEAKKNLLISPEAIADFNVPGYYQDPEGHRKAMRRLSRDAWMAYSCAIAYQLSTGNEKTQFAKKAVEVLVNWGETNKKTSNYDGDLAMADAGVGLVFAAELLSDYKGWGKDERVVFENWISSVYLNSCSKVAQQENNWGDWGGLGCIASHYFLDDKSALKADVEQLKKKIDKAIDADGSMPHEIKRGKRGMWYTYFALAPMTASCQIALNACAVDLFHYKGRDGAGIEEALDYLLRYEKAPGEWPHYSEEDLLKGNPGKYPGNLFEAMYGIYAKDAYGDWVKESRPILIYGHHYAWAVPTLLRTHSVGKH